MKNNHEPKAMRFTDTLPTPGDETDFFKEWKNPSEVAQMFKVTIRTIYRWRRNKELPYAKMGGIYYFPILSINQLMTKRAQNSLRRAFENE
ncbi:MAG: helix-turn-helix domain-containing protein [Flavobacteriaceae bacterium]